jgi:transmembrane 9 superfamily protein 3
MMVLFLVGLVTMILLRTLRKDYARYGKDDDLDDMVNKNKSRNEFRFIGLF